MCCKIEKSSYMMPRFYYYAKHNVYYLHIRITGLVNYKKLGKALMQMNIDGNE